MKIETVAPNDSHSTNSKKNVDTLKLHKHLPLLIVDDDDVDRLHLMRWCKKNGFDFKVASNGLEAHELIKQGQFGLIFSDIDMPYMDGIRLAKSIREEENKTHFHIPIVAVSGNEQILFSENFGTLGFDYFIPKPANSDEIKFVISKFYHDK